MTDQLLQCQSEDAIASVSSLEPQLEECQDTAVQSEVGESSLARILIRVGRTIMPQCITTMTSCPPRVRFRQQKMLGRTEFRFVVKQRLCSGSNSMSLPIQQGPTQLEQSSNRPASNRSKTNSGRSSSLQGGAGATSFQIGFLSLVLSWLCSCKLSPAAARFSQK